MATKKISSPKKKAKPKPRLPWQVGEYSSHQTGKFWIPPQLLLICKLLGIPPMELIYDFLNNAALASWKREGNEAARQKAIEYLLACRYGREHYSETEIAQLLKEADARGMLWPKSPDMKLLDASSKQRSLYDAHWFNQGFWKYNRKL